MARIEWQRAQADAQKLDAAGFGGLVAEPEELSPWGQAARHCWQFCEGWAPERWAIYDALYPVSDWHLLIDLMQDIKKAL